MTTNSPPVLVASETVARSARAQTSGSGVAFFLYLMGAASLVSAVLVGVIALLGGQSATQDLVLSAIGVLCFIGATGAAAIINEIRALRR